MNKVKVGVIGSGYWGSKLIRNFVEISDAEMYAVADIDRTQLNRMEACFPQINLFTQDFREFFILGLDAVAISTPPATHYEIASECLKNGLHVLVEKPLTPSSKDARRLIQLAEKHNCVLMVGHTFEYNSAVHVFKEIITSGELGEIHFIDAVRSSLGLYHQNLNVIWDLAPYDISILIHLLECAPFSVTARGAACFQKAVEDVAYLTLMFPDDISCHLRMSWLDPCKKRRFKVIGSKKIAVYDDVESREKIKIYDKRVNTNRCSDTYGDFQFANLYGHVVSSFIHFEEPLYVECMHFIECIFENKRPLTDGYSGLRVVEIIEAAQLSLKNMGVQVPIPNGYAYDINRQHSRIDLQEPVWNSYAAANML